MFPCSQQLLDYLNRNLLEVGNDQMRAGAPECLRSMMTNKRDGNALHAAGSCRLHASDCIL
jgi:hypothetical protein